mgnify:CR=1 FL=1
MSFDIKDLFMIARSDGMSFNHLKGYINQHYIVLPTEFSIGDHTNKKGENLGSLTVLAIMLEHDIDINEGLLLFKEHYHECCDENSDPEAHKNIRALMKVENKDEIKISQNCLYLRSELEKSINDLWDNRDEITPSNTNAINTVEICIEALNCGATRVAERKDCAPGSEWITHQWLKKAVLLSFRIWDNEVIPGAESMFFDKVPLKYSEYTQAMFKSDGVRIVPPAAVRTGSYIGKNVVVMPSYVNIGAFVDEGTMIDTWATVGSCAQIGKNCHISGGAGIGGVLEPLQAGPTIIEDNCFIGARSEIVEGVIVEEDCVISMGVFIGQSTKIYDRETGETHYGRVPAGSVVVPGNLPSKCGTHSLYAAIIVKKVDEGTLSKTELNNLLRSLD